MKKKTLIIYMAILTFAISFSGCGKKDKPAENQGKSTENTATSTEAVTEQATTEAVLDEEGFIPADDYVKTMGEIINVRVSPDTDADIYRLLEADEVLKRTGYNDEWTRVSIDNSNFYIYSDFVTMTEPPAGGDTDASTATPGDAGSKKVKKIVIDPAKQANINVNQEAIGPGSEETKQGASIGNMGYGLETREYELNLLYAKLLETELVERGYEVVLTREENNIDLSNQSRAQIANESGAAAFIRIQMNFSENREQSGAMAMCMTPDSQFNADLYGESSKLAARLLQGTVEQTEANNHGIYETDRMTVINWSSIPVAIIMPGFLSNDNDEVNLTSEEYQNKIVKGIANGIDYYFAQ